MGDDSGRLMWIWGPLVLVGVLVLVFRIAEDDSGVPVTPGMPASGAGALSSTSVPGSAAGRHGVNDGAHPSSDRPPGYAYPLPPDPRPHPAARGPAPRHPSWVGHAHPPPYPWPGDHSGRYWGVEPTQWGPPIGEYGPDAQVDPYWWVKPEDSGK